MPGNKTLSATGINDSGDIVGSAFNDPNNGPFYGFKRSRNQMSHYDFPAANSTLPFSINNLGDLAGQYSDPVGSGGGFVTVLGRPYQVYFGVFGNNDRGQVVGTGNIGTATVSHIVGVVGTLPLARDDH